MSKSNSKIKSGENFYFVDDLYDWNDYFTNFQQITGGFTSSNVIYIEQTVAEVTNNVDKLHE